MPARSSGGTQDGGMGSIGGASSLNGAKSATASPPPPPRGAVLGQGGPPRDTVWAAWRREAGPTGPSPPGGCPHRGTAKENRPAARRVLRKDSLAPAGRPEMSLR